MRLLFCLYAANRCQALLWLQFPLVQGLQIPSKVKRCETHTCLSQDALHIGPWLTLQHTLDTSLFGMLPSETLSNSLFLSRIDLIFWTHRALYQKEKYCSELLIVKNFHSSIPAKHTASSSVGSLLNVATSLSVSGRFAWFIDKNPHHFPLSPCYGRSYDFDLHLKTLLKKRIAALHLYCSIVQPGTFPIVWSLGFDRVEYWIRIAGKLSL